MAQTRQSGGMNVEEQIRDAENIMKLTPDNSRIYFWWNGLAEIQRCRTKSGKLKKLQEMKVQQIDKHNEYGVFLAGLLGECLYPEESSRAMRHFFVEQHREQLTLRADGAKNN